MKDTFDQIESYYIDLLKEKDREIASLKQNQCNCYQNSSIPNELPNTTDEGGNSLKFEITP